LKDRERRTWHGRFEEEEYQGCSLPVYGMEEHF
jgi:hypothetical protein